MLDRRFRGDVEAIVSKALEKERDRRYASASELAADIRRHLRHEPIVARPSTRLLRLGRWARRNPGLATALGGLASALIVGLVVALLLLDQKAGALAQVTSERNDKLAALTDYDRLGDLPRIQGLIAEADTLWPADPSKVAAMRAWIEQTSELEKRLPAHKDVLDRLRMSATAIPSTDQDLDADSRTAARVRWKLAAASEQFKHDTTAKLVADLTTLVDPDPKKGLLADVRSRLAFAQSVEKETIGKYETKWADAIRSIASKDECPKYGGLKIPPQLGLIPIAKDPMSGLWEFVDLHTSTPGTGPIPERGPDGRLVVTESMGLVLVLLPGGTFRMGAQRPDEETPLTAPNVDPEAFENEVPVREVTLDPFFLSKYEMTQGQWHRLTGKNPSVYIRSRRRDGTVSADRRNPVEQLTWRDCNLWLKRLGMVLPTEAQWEYGARGGTTTPRWTGIGTDGLAEAANLADACCRKNGGNPSWKYESWDDGFAVHAPVRTFAPNPFGLHDVLGNVSEWCRDWYDDRYRAEPRRGDGLMSPISREHAYRSGSWNRDASFVRSGYRGFGMPEFFHGDLGVRPARQVDQ
jgi:formylglycine-generating enzyme required for sulfatase activity